ncbi:hypothetical protein ACFTOW_13880, partial [Lacimonas salitolerans]
MLRLLTVLFCLTLPGLAAANDWAALERPGAIALMRHALAPGTAGQSLLALSHCYVCENRAQEGVIPACA